jgi:hypothetical protein
MLIFVEIAIFIVGLNYLWKGRVSIGKRSLEGQGARVVGLILMSPALIGFVSGLVVGLLIGSGELPKNAQSQASMTESALLFVAPVAALIFALLAMPHESELTRGSQVPDTLPPASQFSNAPETGPLYSSYPALQPIRKPSRSRMKTWGWVILAVEAVLTLGVLGAAAWLLLFNKPYTQQTAADVTPISASVTLTPDFTPTAFVWPTPLPTATPLPANTRVVAPAASRPEVISKIQQQVRQIRGLSPRAPVSLKFVTRAEIVSEYKQRYETHRTELFEEIALNRALGLIQPGVQLDPSSLSTMWSSSLSGVADLDKQTYTVVTDLQNSEVDEKTMVAKEYTLGILQQNFNCAQLQRRARTTDAHMATAALYQGDAAAVSFFYLYGGMTQKQVDYVTSFRSKLYDPPIIPTGVSTRVMSVQYFPGWYGVGFIAALGVAGDNFSWGAINRAYSDPPQSTSQILHSEQYRNRIAPVPVTLPDLGPALGSGWSAITKTDTLGEFITSVHLDEFLRDQQRASQAAEGWRGDSFALWQASGERLAFAWHFVWDKPQDTDEFFAAYSDLLRTRTIESQIAERQDNDLRWYSGKVGSGLVRRSGNKTLVIWGPDRGTVEKLLAAIK